MMRHSLKHVVGIGASAGGLEAIQEFFNHMPRTDELTFIIVQHLSPKFKSMMSQLLAQNTAMPIVIVKNNLALKPGVIYLIPATFEAQIENNHFKLSALKSHKLSHPINTLFKSLAIAYTHQSIGIIFSGTGSDGASGMKEIAKQHGLTIVQNPSEAKYADMPNNAIATQHIHCIISVCDMPDIIHEYLHQPYAFNKDCKQLASIKPQDFSEIFDLLERQFNINFNSYKFNTVSRRIQRRMKLLDIETLATYVQYLKSDSEGLKTLYRDLLIGVTEFFRNPDAFATLETEVIPALFAKLKKSHEMIRVWVNPCATGEEAYTIAILLTEYAEKHSLPASFKLFASDVFSDFVQYAKKGRYSHDAAAHIPLYLLDKYFIKSAEHYEIVPEIKQKILFTTHNLLSEHPFTKMDLISCRNLLIYINAKEQKRITDILRFSLNIGGFLFLGPSEGLTSLEPDLIVHDALWKLYKKTRNSHLPQVSTALNDRFLDKKVTSSSQSFVPSGSLPLYAYNAILKDVVSAGFIIDTAFVILHSVGKAREMIQLPEGTPCLILTKIIVDELKSSLIAALHEAKHGLMSVQYNAIIVHQINENQQTLNLTVHPILDASNKIAYYWVRFEPTKTSRHKKINLITHDAQNNDHQREIIITLEKELSETRTLLESSLENMETVNEEMQSTNEELMASNEEMQSTNEELITANLERTKKIEEVIQTKTDIDNLIRGAEICTIILNNKLEIRIFTPPIEKIFNLVSHDRVVH